MNDRIHEVLAFVLWVALVNPPGGGAGYPGLTAEYAQWTESDSTNERTGTPTMWREPTDIEQRDLFYGIGGKENAPDPSVVYQFVRRANLGTQPKMIVEDDKGRQWILKTGPEARPETTAARIVWAAGYYVDQDYFVRTVQIVGETSFIQDNVRFERLEAVETDLGQWQWEANPFIKTRELEGLKVLVALLRDVDVKMSNNQIRRISWDGVTADVYYISDLGATLGSTGTVWNKIPLFRNLPADRLNHQAAKAKPEQFARGSLVKKVKRGEVIFSSQRSSVASVLRGVSVENARWMGQLLSRLSDAQLSEAFRAGGFDGKEAQVYVSTLRNRIDELRSLTPEVRAAR